MAKPPKPARTTKPIPARPSGGDPRLWLRRVMTHGLLGAVMLGTLWAAYHFARQEVQRATLCDDAPPKVVFLHRPAWMSDEMTAELLRSVAPRDPRPVFNSAVLRECATAMQASPWVRRVNSVRRVFRDAPGDTIEIDCEFRIPTALVKWQDYYWLVDADGFKLPEQYTAAQTPEILFDAQRRTRMRIVEGVRQPPVESGQRWPGDDLAAALELARLLQDRRDMDELIKIDVSNFGGRLDPREAQIALITRWGSEIRWGRAINAKDAFIEIPAQRKLEALAQIRAKYGRVDAMHPWIDIRYDQVTYPAQAELSR